MSSSRFNLGVLPRNQDPPDLDNARQWFQRAAEAGITIAMTYLAELLMNQDPPDLDGARQWWERLASAPPTPSSRTRTLSMLSASLMRMSAAETFACLAALVKASAT